MKTKGYEHQVRDLERSKWDKFFGIWWEQGLGKSKLLIDTVCHLAEQGLINALLVIAPNGVHANLVTQEWPVHAWDSVATSAATYVYYTGRAGTKREQTKIKDLMEHRGFVVLVMSYSAVKTKLGLETAMNFLRIRRAMAALDESTAIADPGSQTSKAIAKLAPFALYRRVMSGTPVADGPFKIFNQVKFLDENYWKQYGLSSFVVFKNCFGIFEKRHANARRRSDGTEIKAHDYNHLVSYRNLDKLHKILEPMSSRVLKEDALDLPPKVYSTIEFDLSDDQRSKYEDLIENMRVELDTEHSIQVDSAITKLMRLQQITSGHLVVESKVPLAVGQLAMTLDNVYQTLNGEIVEILNNGMVLIRGIDSSGVEVVVEKHESEYVRLAKGDRTTVDLFDKPSDNPRLQALESILEPITHKVIIWARFTRDVDSICNLLGEECVRYDGRVNVVDRETALNRFRKDPTVRYFVANPEALSMGVTLTQAKTVIYYSNSFKLEKRLQSEDRAHRIGQDVSVNIIDIVARNTVDGHIVKTLRKKYDLSATVMGDRLREWIS